MSGWVPAGVDAGPTAVECVISGGDDFVLHVGVQDLDSLHLFPTPHRPAAPTPPEDPVATVW
ncbi:hypothetical protein [Spongiactinospora sp. 9N601]|uniref:hypothetical protein n=1 Tax=Spongiactinospora sp. 9N601 TaxID=3375149 RepID=UPI0037AC5967